MAFQVVVAPYKNLKKTVDSSILCESKRGAEMVLDSFRNMYDKNLYQMKIIEVK